MFARGVIRSSTRIQCLSSGARTSFSKPLSTLTPAFSRHSLLKSINQASPLLNKAPSMCAPNMQQTAPTISVSSISSLSTTSTSSASSGGGAGAVPLATGEDSDGTSNSDRIHSAPDNPWPPDIVRPRLEEYYRENVLEDLLVLLYDHNSPDADIEKLSTVYKNEWMPEVSVKDVWNLPIEKLPAFHPEETVTSLISHHAAMYNPPKPTKLRMLRNPIDYSNVKKDALNKFLRPKVEVKNDFAPLLSRMPCLKKITLKIWYEDAASNKGYLLPAIMALQTITGVRADPVFAERGDSTKRIREGMPLGASVTLTHTRMYTFMDKLTQCVLPRLAEWDGFNPAGNGSGTIEFEIPSIAVGQFPDIESYFEMFPRLFDVKVIVETTAKTDLEAVLLLSALQVPFLEQKFVEKVEEAEEDLDPWAKFKKKGRAGKDEKKSVGRKK